MPAWIPGSYMIREFARNIVSIRAESEGSTVRLEKLDKHSWRAGRVTAGATLLVSYEGLCVGPFRPHGTSGPDAWFLQWHECLPAA